MPGRNRLPAGLVLPILAALTFTPARQVSAQGFVLSEGQLADSAALARSMPALARSVLAVYTNSNQRDSLDDVFRFQLVAGEYAAAERSLAALHAMRTSEGAATSAQNRATNVQYSIYVQARTDAAASPRDFAATFPAAFRAAFARMDDRTAAMVMREFGASLPGMVSNLDRATGWQKGKTSISMRDAIALLRSYQMVGTYRSIAPLAPALVAQDDQRRYLIDRDIRIPTPDGATVCAFVVRQRSVKGRAPALLNFTIYADSIATLNEARRTASNGYVGVEGFTRGKACSPDKPVAYEHDGTDADAVINWISRQSWSDGRVGMYGGSYEGFTQWAAAKHLPRALKALMPSVSAAPGIDVPMEGNVFQTFVYYWPFYTTTNKTLDDSALNDRGRWWRMQRDWYVEGKAYRDLDRIDGTPNPVFDKWLNHPAYDTYWQSMIPYREDFARINIPVLTTTGYYDGGEIGALYYLTQHYKYNPNAQHYLVIGPYDHVRGQRGTTSSLGDEFNELNGYVLDPVAHIDLGELRYQWFNFVLKGAPKPELLQGRINFQVMGANRWEHAASLAEMSNHSLELHPVSAKSTGGVYSLVRGAPGALDSVVQKIDLADRTDIDSMFSNNIVDTAFSMWNTVAFVSQPMERVTELNGLFYGHLELVTNKRDFDFNIGLYELTPDGKYVALSYYMARASYVADRTHRKLLTPGARTRLDFTSGRMTSRQFAAGSRLIIEITIIRQPGAQINYGTGKDVSDETVADAGAPLTISWLSTTRFSIPVRY